MRKLLILLGSFMLGINSSAMVAGCNNNSNINTPKHEMTKENLDTFFAANNTFSYKGPSFFKEGIPTDNIHPINQLVETFFENIISTNIKEKFIENFILKENYIFSIKPDNSEELKNLGLIDHINFNQDQQYKFQIEIHINKKDWKEYYTSDWLTISFFETRQYNPEEWLQAYKNFLILESYSVFNNIITRPANSGIVGVDMEDQNWKKKRELIKKYQTDNNFQVLNNIKVGINHYIEPIKNSWQVYKENIFKISKVDSYKYVSIYYQPEDDTEIWSIIENVNITISYDPLYYPKNYSQTFNLNISCY